MSSTSEVNDSRTALANDLIRIRKNKGISQEEASEVIGVTRACYSAWEEGRALPKPRLYYRLLEFTELTEKEFIHSMWSSSNQMKEKNK
jgi:transcriptional regulator with XRE-family HTH domain